MPDICECRASYLLDKITKFLLDEHEVNNPADSSALSLYNKWLYTGGVPPDTDKEAEWLLDVFGMLKRLPYNLLLESAGVAGIIFYPSYL